MHATQVLDTHLRRSCQEMHSYRLNGVVDAVDAALTLRRTSVAGLGRAMAVSCDEKFGIKRADRLVGNTRLHEELPLLYAAQARLIVGSRARPVIIVDGSDLAPDKRFIVIRASAPTDGRALTLYEEVHEGKKDGNRRVLKAFLAKLKEVLPEGAQPILVTDAGFRVPWFKDVEAMGWDWVGRIRHTMLRRNDADAWVYCKDIYALFDKKACHLGEFEITKSNPHRCRVIGVKKLKKGRSKKTAFGERCLSKHSEKNAEREREPWLLATSLREAHAAEIVGLYGKRMQIEEAFRDTKSLQYGLGLEVSRTRSADRLAVLLAISALAVFAAWLIGKAAEAKDLARGFQANSVRSRRVLSTIFVGLAAVRKKLRFTYEDIKAVLAELGQPCPESPLIVRAER
jgi:hypothetical protein